MKHRRVITTALVILSGGVLAAPAEASAHRSRRTQHVAARSRTISFYATVIRANAKGLMVRTRAGRMLKFSAAEIGRTHHSSSKPHAHRARHHGARGHASDTPPAVGPVAVNIVGLQPGVTVLITETVASDGSVTVTITLPPNTGSGQQQASGVVTDVGDDSFELTAASGGDLRLHMASEQLSNLNLQSCETVNVSYHQDAGMLIADSAQVTGSSSSGDCAPTYDATGVITQVSGQSVSITGGQGPMTFAVSDPSVTECFQTGDVVDVTYTQNAEGTMTATNVQYVEQDARGKVTAVSPTSLTITDSSSGQPATFVADPSQGLQLNTDAFTGLKVGDQIDVTYHQSATGNVADTVGDEPGDS